MKKNILITAVKNYEHRDDCHYFFTTDGENVRFVDGVVVGEAGSKLILSKNEIDEIILVGSDLQLSESQEAGKKIPLSEGISLVNADVERLSDFDYFRYRLLQFTEGVDMESADLFDSIPVERRKEIQSLVREILGEDKSNYLWKIYGSPALWRQILSRIQDARKADIIWTQNYLYTLSQKEDRITCNENTGNIPISFVPIAKSDKTSSMMNSIHNLLSLLYVDSDYDISLFLDVQGFEPADSYIFLSMLTMICNISSQIEIKDIMSTSDIPVGFLYCTSNSKKRIGVAELLSAIGSLVNDGRVDQLREYWYKANIHNDYLDKMMYALGEIETGILLCNIDALEAGILFLYDLVSQDDMVIKESESEEEAFIFALREAILADYGLLIDPETEELDPLELVKWSWRKGFYQQAITIIESKMPHHFVRKGIFYPCATLEEKEKYLKNINAFYWDAQRKDRWKFEDFNHFFIKDYGNVIYSTTCPPDKMISNYRAEVRASQVYADKPIGGLLKANSLLENEADFLKVFKSYHDICALRNSINHGESISNKKKSSLNFREEPPLMKKVKNAIKTFIDIFEDAMWSVADKPNNVVPLTREEIHDFCYSHGPRDYKDCFKAEGFISDRKMREKVTSNQSGQKSVHKNYQK